MNTTFAKLTAVAFGLSTLVIASTSARAEIVCNGDGDCWHTHEAYSYPSGVGIVVHPDDWRWEGDRYHWHEHEGRGYWHGHAWVPF